MIRLAKVTETSKKRVSLHLVLDCISAFARFFMAYIWLAAGISKLNNRMETAQSIRAYEIFTDTWSNGLASVIGPLEIAGGVLLLFGIFLRKASWISVTVLVLFIAGIAQAWARNLGIDCGCFGPQGLGENTARDYALIIIRDIFFIALSLWTVYRPFKKFALYA
ncbi:DoxX family membrane protein [Corynebacterium diphtheriae]|nr:DoxX family membrane protein [Corynebacterium diphtheriae]CAB0758627.1 DoxX family membrane protein [Corynebacterium diphtheriae]